MVVLQKEAMITWKIKIKLKLARSGIADHLMYRMKERYVITKGKKCPEWGPEFRGHEKGSA